MKKILIAPLDWGLGHATRCIPVIRMLQYKKCEVFIAGSGSSLDLLRAEFPSLKFFTLPPYDPVYPTSGSMVWKMAAQLPKFIRTISAEHNQLEKLIETHHIDLVISDNRYGCWSGKVPSIFITHQSNILMPERFGWLSRWVRAANENRMKKFSRCWIPDFPGNHSLAGELIAFGKLHKKINVDFIGPLSRFTPVAVKEKKYDVVAICSGPEPQRSLLEKLLLKELSPSSLHFLIVRGVTTTCRSSTLSDRGKIVNFLTSTQLEKVMEQTDLVIGRSGYSTIMDMAALGKQAVFIPTPGQTEQEYLAARMKERGIAFFMKQDKFDITTALQEMKNYTGFSGLSARHDLLSHAISNVLAL